MPDIPPPSSPTSRRFWLGAVGVRVAISVVALPLTPALFRDQLVALVAMRPTREFLVLGGFQVRSGEIALAALIAASIPMVVLGMWVFYGLGRAYRDQFTGDDLPSWLARSVDPEQVQRLRGVLQRRGVLLVVLARLAIFPTTLLAAAAGASDMAPRRYLTADAVGATLAYVQYVGVGYVLGRTYESAGPWIAAIGVALLAIILWVFGRALREEDTPDAGEAAPARDGWHLEPEPDTPSA